MRIEDFLKAFMPPQVLKTFIKMTKKGGGVMKSICIFLFALIVGLTLGCASPQDKAYKAEEKVHNERLKLVEQYQQCLKDAGDDKLKSEACEQYLKAAEALK